jgi:hypothetical protein
LIKPTEKIQERPLAKANPSAYIPNRIFENRLESMVRSTNGKTTMTSPAVGALIKTENGVAKLNFKGSVPANEDNSQFPLVLKIFDNQNSDDKFLYRVLPAKTNRDNPQWSFSSAQRLKLQPGLYYYTLERQMDDDLLYVGKFTVE